jgi:hypothetical protein
MKEESRPACKVKVPARRVEKVTAVGSNERLNFLYAVNEVVHN